MVGYDDLRIAEWAGPPLTTIHVPLAAMAEQAARLALRLRDEPELAFSRIDMATCLVVRESTAPQRYSLTPLRWSGPTRPHFRVSGNETFSPGTKT